MDRITMAKEHHGKWRGGPIGERGKNPSTTHNLRAVASRGVV